MKTFISQQLLTDVNGNKICRLNAADKKYNDFVRQNFEKFYLASKPQRKCKAQSIGQVLSQRTFYIK